MRQGLRRYVVERRVPEMTSDDLDGLHSALAEASHRLSANSREVVCMRTIYLPSTEHGSRSSLRTRQTRSSAPRRSLSSRRARFTKRSR